MIDIKNGESSDGRINEGIDGRMKGESDTGLKNSEMGSKKRTGRIVRIFFCAVAAFLALTAGVTYIVDPFFHYHAPLSGFPYIVDNQISQNPGMAANMTYDSFITGSSMTVNFDTDDFTDIGGKTIKLCYDGAYPGNLNAIMKIVFDRDTYARKHNPVKAAFIGMDPISYTASPDETKFPLETYLYDDNPFNDIKYLLNKDVYLQYIVKPMLTNKGTDLTRAYYMDWLTEDMFGKKYVLSSYAASEVRDDVTDKDAFIAATKLNLDEDILPYITENPDTEFYFFFPPYSILYWHNFVNENNFEARLEQERFIAKTLLEHSNVRVFFFSDWEEVVTDLDNYTDYTHHRPEINARIAKAFMTGEHELTQDSVDEHINGVREMVENYDFEGLFESNEAQ